ncbi:hypothetical protein [Rhodococcus koreensis]|uniref:hypothetical protein n=1 Tax=Rhodococcus koreensis TaxID=99653 RepID=UPI00366C7327
MICRPLLRDHETGRFTVDDLCAGYDLKKTALYENLKLARNERAGAAPQPELAEDELSA